MKIGLVLRAGRAFLSLPLEPDRPVRDRCGQCRLCLDACPTNAFVGPLTFWTPEMNLLSHHRTEGADSRELRPLMGTHVFGCDICQDVCPYNTKCRATHEAAFNRGGASTPRSRSHFCSYRGGVQGEVPAEARSCGPSGAGFSGTCASRSGISAARRPYRRWRRRSPTIPTRWCGCTPLGRSDESRDQRRKRRSTRRSDTNVMRR